MSTVVFTKRYAAKSKTGYKQFSGSILREMQSVNILGMTESEKISIKSSFLNFSVNKSLHTRPYTPYVHVKHSTLSIQFAIKFHKLKITGFYTT